MSNDVSSWRYRLLCNSYLDKDEQAYSELDNDRLRDQYKVLAEESRREVAASQEKREHSPAVQLICAAAYSLVTAVTTTLKLICLCAEAVITKARAAASIVIGLLISACALIGDCLKNTKTRSQNFAQQPFPGMGRR
jgi:hypothetical protein